MVAASKQIETYFKSLRSEVATCYEIATKAREKNLDPAPTPEIMLANTMADRVIGLVSMVAPQLLKTTIPERVQELELKYGALDWRVGFIIAEEVAKEKFCKFTDKREAMEVGIRTGFAYLTLGIVAAPLEGFVGLEIKKRKDGKEYFGLRYAGPVRGAGGTASSSSVILADYVRIKMGYAPYDPTEKEVSRYITEVHDYHDRVTNLQYHPSDEEIKFMTSHVPVEVTGDPTERIEVSNHKDLERIPTNLIRGGMCLVVAEGLCQKAPKLWKRLSKWGKEMDLEWEFLDEFIKLKEKIHAQHDGSSSPQEIQGKTTKKNSKLKPKANNTFIMDIVAGRPVLTDPLEVGGFRLRYGRGRTSGFSATAIHPATMVVLNNYIAIGTQLKVERPGKAASITSCDTIEGPIVKLHDGTVLKLNSQEIAKQHFKEIKEIIFLGDILFNYGDFSENGQKLVPPGYCPEWWKLEVEKALCEKYSVQLVGKKELTLFSKEISSDLEKIEQWYNEPLLSIPTSSQSLEVSALLNVPLHPEYTLYYDCISFENFVVLCKYLQKGKIKKNPTGEILKIVLPYNITDELSLQAKLVLEHLGVPHQVITNESIVISQKESNIIVTSIFPIIETIQNEQNIDEEYETAFDYLQKHSTILLREKGGTFVGARMGRPEKAKMRAMKGSPHGLFPIGEEGGRLRSFQAALQKGKVTSQFSSYFCTTCSKSSIYQKCEECDAVCEPKYHCRTCGDIDKEVCRHGNAVLYKNTEIDLAFYFRKAKERLGANLHPDLIKGVRGTSNKDRVVEHLSKAILRAKHRITVNKDGTTRYDMTELPLTHFKPKEIQTSIKKLIELGYTHDIYGKKLEEENQLLELKPQDVVMPGFDSIEESSIQVLMRIAQFVDDLLVKFYHLEPFYNVKTPQDLAGHLIIGLAPHISAGTIGRIIGFSQTQGMLTHPMYHAGLRRDCVHPTTRFLYNDGREHYEEIGFKVEQLISAGAKLTPIDSVGTVRVECDKKYKVYGVDPVTKKLEQKKVKYFIKGPPPPHWIKIRTATNREFICTPTHDFLYIENDNFKSKKAQNIQVGDKVPILSRLNLEKTTIGINLIEEFCMKLPPEALEKIYIKSENFFRNLVKRKGKKEIIKHVGLVYMKKNMSEWYLKTPLSDIKRMIQANLLSADDLKSSSLHVKFSKHSHKAVLPIDQNLCSLLGYYAAEGYSRQSKSVSQVAFRICESTLKGRIIDLIKQVFKISPNLGEDKTKITICDQLVYNLFKYVFDCGDSAYTKKIPDILLEAREKCSQAFVSAFIDGDGSVVSQRNAIVMYSVSRKLLDGVALLLTRIGVVSRYSTTKPRFPGKKVLQRYEKLKTEPKAHVLHHLIINGPDVCILRDQLTLYSPAKKQKGDMLNQIDRRKTLSEGRFVNLEEKGDVVFDYIKNVETIPSKQNSYCLEVEFKKKEERNILWGEQILNYRCDGDEAAALLLLDGLLNFSKRYLPTTRGSTMDAPLVLTPILDPKEVDDQVLGIDVMWKYPLEFYEAAQEMKAPWDVKFGADKKKITQLDDRLGTELQYEDFGFTHPVDNFNKAIQCSAYKTLPTMKEKLFGQMDIAQKVRAVNMGNVARLVIQRHFLADIKGNLRKFSMQTFRCSTCNAKYRRPPLSRKCTECGAPKLLFTISEGSVVKYLEPSMELAREYDFSPYLKETIQLLKINIGAVFGKGRDKQTGLGAFMVK